MGPKSFRDLEIKCFILITMALSPPRTHSLHLDMGLWNVLLCYFPAECGFTKSVLYSLSCNCGSLRSQSQ